MRPDNILASFKIELGVLKSQQDIDDAISQIDRVSEAIAGLNTAAAGAGVGMGRVGGDIDVLNASMSELLRTTDGLSIAHDRYSDIIDQLISGQLKYSKLSKEHRDNIDKMISRVSEISGEYGILDNTLKKVVDDMEKVENIANADAKIFEENADAVGLAKKGIEFLGANAADTAGMMEFLGGSAAEAGIALGPIGVIAMIVGGALISALSAGIEMVIQNFEEFKTTNYRAIGSMQQLRAATFEAVGQFGALAEEAVDTIKSILYAGIVIKDLAKQMGNLEGGVMADRRAFNALIETNYKFAKASGMSNASIAMMQRRMIVGNVALNAQKALFGNLTKYMRAYGVEGSDLEEIMSNVNEITVRLNSSVSGASYGNLTREFVTAAAAAKNLGISVSKTAGFISELIERPLDHIVMLGNAAFGSVEDITAAARAKAMEVLPMMENIAKTNRWLLPTYEEMYGPLDVLRAMAEAQQMMDRAAAGDKTAQMWLKQKEAAEELDKAWEEATNTFTEEMKKLRGPFTELLVTITGPLVDALTDIIHWMSKWAKIISDVIKWFRGLDDTTVVVLKSIVGALIKTTSFIMGPFGTALNMVYDMFVALNLVADDHSEASKKMNDNIARTADEMESVVNNGNSATSSIQGMRAAAADLSRTTDALASSNNGLAVTLAATSNNVGASTSHVDKMTEASSKLDIVLKMILGTAKLLIKPFTALGDQMAKIYEKMPKFNVLESIMNKFNYGTTDEDSIAKIEAMEKRYDYARRAMKESWRSEEEISMLRKSFVKLGEAIEEAKSKQFGSSWFYIKEGVTAALPHLQKLGNTFDNVGEKLELAKSMSTDALASVEVSPKANIIPKINMLPNTELMDYAKFSEVMSSVMRNNVIRIDSDNNIKATTTSGNASDPVARYIPQPTNEEKNRSKALVESVTQISNKLTKISENNGDDEIKRLLRDIHSAIVSSKDNNGDNSFGSRSFRWS